ncbi:SidA/IucD/PvdA family monooxygenase [Streptomyces rishiriensis]|uniref:SidA/IucD/PvdA family monooxygenase n=1 Tax=Streptomyces rishiriensis TaxID=68264 RepID=UPI00378DA63B
MNQPAIAPYDQVPDMDTDARTEFRRHPGLLVDEARVQVPFLADLVSLAERPMTSPSSVPAGPAPRSSSTSVGAPDLRPRRPPGRRDPQRGRGPHRPSAPRPHPLPARTAWTSFAPPTPADSRPHENDSVPAHAR